MLGKILGIDIGEKRSGLAISDETQTFAFGLTAVSTDILIPFIEKIKKDYILDKIVIGEPKPLRGNKPLAIEFFIQKIIKKIIERIKIPIDRIDERFTSKMAVNAIYESGLSKKKRRNKFLIDEVSATLILQFYLDRKKI